MSSKIGGYRIVRELGSGAMGRVVLCDKGDRGLLAVKILDKLGGDKKVERVIEKFKSEFTLLKKLSHPGINRVYDFGFDKDFGRYFFSEEYIEGGNFLDWAERAVSVDAVLGLFVELLRALQYLHSHGVMHCDIKSANALVVSEKGGSCHAKLIDFGLAVLGAQSNIVGTPTYMAPEIILKNRPDNRADLYSLGVLIYSALAGQNPFHAADMNAAFEKQLHLLPEPLSKLNPEVPAYLDKIVLGLLSKSPANRPPTAAHVIRAINIGGGKSYPVETAETVSGYLPAEGALVGRQKEMQRLKDALAAAKEGKGDAPFLFCIEGEEGAGKKRLLRELKYHAQLNEFDVLEIAGPDFAKRVSEKIGNMDSPILLAFSNMRRLSTDNAAAGIFEMLRKLIKRVRAERSLGRIREAPKVLIVFTAIPDEVPLFLHLLEISGADMDSIRLANFDRGEVSDYVSALTGIGDPPSALVDELMRRTEGNPLFVTEFLRGLIAGGALFDKTGRRNREAVEDMGIRFEGLKLPKTLDQMLERRYATLSEGERKVLCALAAWGRPAGIGEIGAAAQEEDVHGCISSLIREGIVSADPVQGSYSFANALMRDSVYASLPPAERRPLHDTIAKYLLQFEPDGVAEIMRHTGKGTDTAAAIDALIGLGLGCIGRGAAFEAASLFNDALSRLGGDAYRRDEILLHLGESYVISRRYSDAIGTYLKLMEHQGEDAGGLPVTLRKLAVAYLRNEDISGAEAVLLRAKEYLEGDLDPNGLNILNLIARTEFLKGNIDKAVELYRGAREKWERLSAAERKEVRNNDLAHAYLQKGDLDLAKAEFEKDMAFFAEIGAENEMERACYSYAELMRLRGDAAASREHLEKAIEIAKRLEDTELLIRAYNGLGNACQAEANFGKALYWYGRGFDLALRTGEENIAAAISLNIGLVFGDSGDLAKAADYLDSAIKLLRRAARKTPLDDGYIIKAHVELANIFRRKKEFDAAAGHLSEAERVLREGRGLEEQSPLIEEARRALASGADRKKATIMDMTLSGEDKEEDMPEKYFQYILEINKYLSGETDLDFILKTILKYALELSGAKSGLVLLLGGDGEFKVRASCNVELSDKLSEISTQIAKAAVEKDDMLVTNDASSDEQFRSSESVMLLDLKSVVAVPVHVKKKVTGVMYLEDRTRPSAFTDISREVISAFADQAGIAIENAMLIKKHEEKEEELKKELSESSIQVDKLDAQIKSQSDQLAGKYRFDRLISVNKKMRDVFALLDRIKDTNLSVCITGESGTGKELVARALHYNSIRSRGPFIAVNCGAIPATLIESELFGYRAGAFTGATRDKTGFFEAASGGTMLLDEICELDMALQAKLLRVIQEHEVVRVGDTKPRKCDARIISATNRDIEAMAKEKKFREDLYYRLSEIKIEIPPLRARTEDIPLLVDEMIAEYCREHGLKKVPTAGASFIGGCMSYPWPGNIRELENTMRVGCALAGEGKITIDALPDNNALKQFAGGAKSEDESTLPLSALAPIDELNRYDPTKSWERYEREIVASAYKACGFDAKESAASLGIALATMYKKISEFGLKDPAAPVFSAPFKYSKGTTLEAYITAVFKAAWEYSGRRPYTAIKALDISQGYFYKVMKKW